MFSFHWNDLGLADTFAKEGEDVAIGSCVSIRIGTSSDTVCALALYTVKEKKSDILFTLTIDKKDKEYSPSIKEIITELMEGFVIKKDIFGDA